jgi:hypothetical protein
VFGIIVTRVAYLSLDSISLIVRVLNGMSHACTETFPAHNLSEHNRTQYAHRSTVLPQSVQPGMASIPTSGWLFLASGEDCRSESDVDEKAWQLALLATMVSDLPLPAIHSGLAPKFVNKKLLRWLIFFLAVSFCLWFLGFIDSFQFPPPPPFRPPPRPSPFNRSLAVRDAFVHAYSGYLNYASPSDELLPVTGGKVDKYVSLPSTFTFLSLPSKLQRLGTVYCRCFRYHVDHGSQG